MTHVPLSARSSQEIRAQGEIYLHMALTARTPEARLGLEVVARRFAVIADRREAEERRDASEADPAAPLAKPGSSQAGSGPGRQTGDGPGRQTGRG